MERTEFLEKLGLGAAFVLSVTCLGGCTKDDAFVPTEAVDFVLDLDAPANSNLAANGGYLIRDRVVVARDNTGAFVAATQRCSHEGTYAIILKSDEWICTDHDARFDLNGNGLNREGNRDLTIYKTELIDNTLRVYS